MATGAGEGDAIHFVVRLRAMPPIAPWRPRVLKTTRYATQAPVRAALARRHGNRHYVRQARSRMKIAPGNVGGTMPACPGHECRTGISIPQTAPRIPQDVSKLGCVPRHRGGAPVGDSRQIPQRGSRRLHELASGESKDAETLEIRADARVLARRCGRDLHYPRLHAASSDPCPPKLPPT